MTRSLFFSLLLITAVASAQDQTRRRQAAVRINFGNVPDPTALPLLTSGTSDPDFTSYNALNVDSMAAGGSYSDPTSGVTIWKATSSTVPVSNTGAGHDYADGPVQVSRGWGADRNSHTIVVRGEGGLTYKLVDFTRGSGFSNWRDFPSGSAPASDLCASFSYVIDTPRILYSFNGTNLQRINTETDAVENTGNFPQALSSGCWLHQDITDTWFVKTTSGVKAQAWNSQTDTLLEEAWAPVDEARMEHNGEWVALGEGTSTLMWHLPSDTTHGPYARASTWPFFHNASMIYYFINIDADRSGFPNQRLDPSNPVTDTDILSPGIMGAGHLSGHWVQPWYTLPNGDLQKQWVHASTNEDWGAQNVLVANGIAMFRADGSEVRLIAHVYDTNATYWDLPFATSSPDGKVVIFNSNMNDSGRYDLFVIEMPLTP